MIEWLIWGAIATAIGGTLIAVFWDQIRSFLKQCYEFAVTLIELVKIGFKVFLKRMNGYVEEICRIYTKNKMDQWEIVTQIQKVSENDIPDEIRRKLIAHKEVDITDEVQQKIAV